MAKTWNLQKLFRILFVLAIVAFFQAQGHRHRHGSRARCRKCPPGSGVLTACTQGGPTSCGPCANGTYSSFSSASSPCLPCSRCGEGLYVAHPCLPTRDTICDSCHTYRGPHNEDYVRRCASGTRQDGRGGGGNTKDKDPKALGATGTEVLFNVNSTYVNPARRPGGRYSPESGAGSGESPLEGGKAGNGSGLVIGDSQCRSGQGCLTTSRFWSRREIPQVAAIMSGVILCWLLLMTICLSCCITKVNNGRGYKVVATIEDV